MAKSSKLDTDVGSYTSVGTPLFVDGDHEAQDFDAKVTVHDSECDAKHMSSCRRAVFLSAAAVAALALVSLAALALNFRNGATNPAGLADLNVIVELNEQPDKYAFCWLVSASWGGEAELVRDHFAKGRSIFECSDWTVFSDGSLDPVPVTNIGSMSSQMGSWGGLLNTEIFLRAWDALIKEGKYARHSWTVKVDADTVFFDSRLRYHLGGVNPQDPVWYRDGTNWSGELLLGAIEVFSLGAMNAFAARGRSVCQWGIQDSGEDGFIDHCMEQLGAAVRFDGSLLTSTKNPGDCWDGGSAAFHPFKDLGSYSACQAIADR